MKMIALIALVLSSTLIFANVDKGVSCSQYNKTAKYMVADLDKYPGETLYFAVDMDSSCKMGSTVYKYWKAHKGQESKLGYQCKPLNKILAMIFDENNVQNISGYEKRMEMDVLGTVTKNTNKSFGTYVTLKSKKSKSGKCEIETHVVIDHKEYKLKHIHVIKGGVSLTLNPRLRSAVITVDSYGQEKKIRIEQD